MDADSPDGGLDTLSISGHLSRIPNLMAGSLEKPPGFPGQAGLENRRIFGSYAGLAGFFGLTGFLVWPAFWFDRLFG